MVTMPDGVQFDMQWKSVTYDNKKHSITFEIIPMVEGKDLLFVPDAQCWKKITSAFSDQERLEIIFLLERINWKRNLHIVEIKYDPEIDTGVKIIPGSIESTQACKYLAKQNLFDPQSPITTEQVKKLYCGIEKRFAEAASGKVTIPKSILLSGSVIAEISVPTLQANKKVELHLI